MVLEEQTDRNKRQPSNQTDKIAGIIESSNHRNVIYIYIFVLMAKKRHDKSTKRQPDYLLFFGNLDHQNEFAPYFKSRLHPFPNIDQISFRKPVKIHLIRIVRPKGNLYQQFASINNITQQQPIKRLQIFYKNLERRSSDYARYGVIARNSQVRENNPDKDVLYGLQKGVDNYDKVITDLLILSGFFTKLTLCVYGCILQEDSRQCYFYGKNIPLQIFKHNKSSISQFAKQQHIDDSDKMVYIYYQQIVLFCYFILSRILFELTYSVNAFNHPSGQAFSSISKKPTFIYLTWNTLPNLILTTSAFNNSIKRQTSCTSCC